VTAAERIHAQCRPMAVGRTDALLLTVDPMDAPCLPMDATLRHLMEAVSGEDRWAVSAEAEDRTAADTPPVVAGTGAVAGTAAVEDTVGAEDTAAAEDMEATVNPVPLI
jgi:hypothetical protein